MEKKLLRKKYTKLRQAYSQEEIDDLSLQIANQILQLEIWDKIYYHIFLPITSKKEINTEFILHILQGKDKSVVISKADFETNLLHNFLLQENTSISISKHGIPEPIDGIEISEDKLDVIFVPLLAFDVLGSRIGYGKGFYDRFLGKCNPRTVKIGLSFFEAEEKINNSETDIKLDFCVTPSKIYAF